MKKIAALVLLLTAGAVGRAEDAPKMPAPQKEHEWLARFVGEWETDAEMVMAPGQPPVKSKGTETVKSLGGFWIVSELKSECFGVPVTGQMTVGYEPGKKKYVGTWVCSMSDWLCKYEGRVEGDTLTLECEGPSPADPAKTVKMKDVVEVKSPDHRVLTSYIQGDDGKWTQFMTMTARRKK